MHRPSFYKKNAVARLRSGLTQTIRNVQRLLIACLCVEKCRFCGKELALAISSPPRLDFDLAQSQGNAMLELMTPTNSEIHQTPTRGELRQIRHSFSRLLEKQLELPAVVKTAKESLARAPDRAPILRKILLNLSNSLMTEIVAEIKDILKSATHANLVAPAFVYFSKQSPFAPRFSECVCNLCWDEIEIDLPLLGFCKLENPNQTMLPIASGVSYDGRVKELIRTFKYKGDTTLTGDLTCLLSMGWPALNDFMPASEIVLIPVPLHAKRRKARGYNQSDLLAKQLGELLEVQVRTNALRRNKVTKSQQQLGRPERLENVRHAFVGNRKLIAGKTVVLIDDVCTSGATLVACAEEALECGALSVVGLTIARAILAHDQ